MPRRSCVLYDRAFLSGSFKKALLQRWPLYLGLAHMGSAGSAHLLRSDRNATVGSGMGWLGGLCADPGQAIVRYLSLAFGRRTGIRLRQGCDHRLQYCMATDIVSSAAVGATAYATARQPKLGFGLLVFGILAPSSSVIPLTTQTMAEHRMYLPLIAVVAVRRSGSLPRRTRMRACLCFRGRAAGWGTTRRNEVYRSAVGLWDDTVRKRPGNDGHTTWETYLTARRRSEALASYDKAVQLRPDYPWPTTTRPSVS